MRSSTSSAGIDSIIVKNEERETVTPIFHFLPAQHPEGFDRESFHQPLSSNGLQFLQNHAS